MGNIRVLGNTPLFRQQLQIQGNTAAFRALALSERTALKAFEIMGQVRPQLTELTINSKQAPCDWVTKADTSIQAEQIKNILAEFPEHKMIAEEEHDDSLSADASDRDIWYLDGVDGTAAFARKTENVFGQMDYLLPGFVQFGMQMAYLHDGIPVYSVFAAPEMNIDGLGYSIFEAVDGIEGAFLNGNRISFSAVGPLSDSISFISLRGELSETELREHLISRGVTGRCVTRSVSTGSEFALLLQRPPALDRFNLVVTEREKPWDLMPGAFLIEKAGGGIRFLDGTGVFPFNLDCLGADGRSQPVAAASLSNLSFVLSLVKEFSTGRSF